jgi:hypothetical protein
VQHGVAQYKVVGNVAAFLEFTHAGKFLRQRLHLGVYEGSSAYICMKSENICHLESGGSKQNGFLRDIWRFRRA